MTSRTLAYREDHDSQVLDWAHYELNPLDDRRVDSFLEAWQKHVTGNLFGRGLSLSEICRTPEVRRLTREPLLLTLLALVHTFSGERPSSRAQLFEGAIDLFLWKWEKVRGSSQGSRLQGLLRQAGVSHLLFRAGLDRLASEAHIQDCLREETRSARVLREISILAELRELHPQRSLDWARELLEVLRFHSGLVAQDSTEEALRFSHESLHALMAGTHLTRERNFGKTAADLLARSLRFKEMILLAVSSLVHHQGEYERPLSLVDVLCPPLPKVDWFQVWIAGEILLEMELHNVRKVPMGLWLLERVQRRLTELLEVGSLLPPERAQAADILGKLGDPRFDPQRFHLPSLFRGKPEALFGFVKVPAGTFMMGSREGDRDADVWEMGNQEPLTIPYDYWIARYPVTVAQYQVFLEDQGYETAAWWAVANKAGWRWRQVDMAKTYSKEDPDAWLAQYSDLRSSRSHPAGWEQQMLHRNRPVTGVCWFEAMAYADWLGVRLQEGKWIPEGCTLRLPTEDEWEKAARPRDSGVYPWGDTGWTESRSNTLRSKIRNPTPVGMYPEGASELGLFDLSGNVEEWTLTSFQPYPYSAQDGRNAVDEATVRNLRMVRGGSCQLEIHESRCAARRWDPPHYFSGDRGFRLVLSNAL